jgi:outer membrane protein assembly factor BamB
MLSRRTLASFFATAAVVASGCGTGDKSAATNGAASVTLFHNHVNRDGSFVDPTITKAKAGTFHLDTTFAGALAIGGKPGGNVYASPLYVESGVAGKGTFYVVTENANVFALDESTGTVVWSKNVATPAQNSGAGCGNVSPIGITGTPAIDLGTRLMVFDSVSADGQGNVATHTIYGLSLDDGSTKWSVDVSTLSYMGTQFSPQPQQQRGAVLLLNGVAYVVYGGLWGDCGSYYGWVVGVPLSGMGAKAWATKVNGAGIWGVGGAASDGQSIYVTTGNGIRGSAVTWAESEGLFRLDPGPSFTGQTADYFAPYDWASLDAQDLDLSGSGPLVIDAPALTPSALVMAQGKDGYLYLLDRSNLGGIATMNQLAPIGALRVESGEISNGGAWATVGGTTYVVVRPNGGEAGMGCPGGQQGDLVAVKLDPTQPQKMAVVWCANSHGIGSPSITTTDGSSDALVWVHGADGGGTGQLYAFDLATGAPVFAGGTSSDVAPNVRRFTTPVPVHGRIFVAGDNQLYAFAAMERD